MKVLHVIAPVSMGGGETLLLNLLSEKREGIEESIALIYSSRAFEESLKNSGVQIFRLRKNNIGHGISKLKMGFETFINLTLVLKILTLIRNNDIDIIHAHGYPASILVWLTKKFATIKTVYTHHSVRVKPNVLEKAVFKRVYSSFDACSGVSNLVSRTMNNAFFNGKSVFKTIYNCVGNGFLQKSSNMAGKKEVRNDGRVFFIQVGRFTKYKNQILVAEAFSKLDSTQKDKIYITFVGDGEEKEFVEKYVNDNKLQSHFNFMGEVEYSKIAGLIASCDFGLFPSENEAFGISAIECLALGLPVLSLDNETMREVIGQAGIFVSKEKFHLGLIQMIQEGAKLKEEAEKRGSQFSAQKIKLQYVELYYFIKK